MGACQSSLHPSEDSSAADTVETHNDLDRSDVSSAGFAHSDSADLFGGVVLSADDFERTAAADGADEAAFGGGAFVVSVECVG
ncbi:MAG: hypothetical protein NT138_00710 [Planctomycetales bacterium]|jgi:hypothetical protein|nr:hypothetical protein [Planctomycetales bacterium]